MALDSGYWETDKDMNVPTKADLVEVVRCGKCEFYDEEGEFCKFWNGVRHPEHFCGEGERKEA